MGVPGRRRGDRGATAVEYALVASLIAVVALVGIVYVGRSLSGSFEESTLAIGAAVGETSSETATATPTPTPTATPAPTPTSSSASPTATSSAQSVFVAQAETITFPPASWTRVGNSANYRWECANGYTLGSLQDVRSTSTPPGPAPECG